MQKTEAVLGVRVAMRTVIGLWFDFVGALWMVLAVFLAGGLVARVVLMLRAFE
jgi:Flp pilus assembly protein protease CpaA